MSFFQFTGTKATVSILHIQFSNCFFSVFLTMTTLKSYYNVEGTMPIMLLYVGTNNT